MIDSEQARRLAITRWEDNFSNTFATDTNRDGAYFVTTAGHGGYVVDQRALTADEIKAIEKIAKGHVKHPSATGDGHAVYTFEEDCEWTVLYKFTDIRAEDSLSTDELVESIFNQYFGEQTGS